MSRARNQVHLVGACIAAVALLGIAGCAGHTGVQNAASTRIVTRIPVLLYHGITVSGPIDHNTSSDENNSVHLAAFTAQMRELHVEGYQSISPAQYVAWRHGDSAGLPARPVLITFDCGETTAALAEPVLKEYGFRPVMFVVSGFADGGYGTGTYLSWTGLTVLAADGWYMQFHAGPCGHGYTTNNSPYHCGTGLDTTAGNAHTGHRYYANPFGQAPATYHARVAQDIALGMGDMRSEFGLPANWQSVTFAVPWDDWGQPGTSNQPWLAKYLAAHYPVVFVQGSWPGLATAQADHMRYRFEVDDSTTQAQFTTALADGRFA